MPTDMFLKIDGIRGESVDAKHKDEIIVRGFNWAAKQTGGHTGTKTHAKASFSDLVLYKYIDRSSPVLFRLCTTGQKIRRAVFYARKAGGKPVEYLKIILDEVSVHSINLIPDEAAIFVEKIALRVARFRYAYTPKRSDGTDAPSVEMGWNIAHNCGIFEAAIATSTPPRRPAPAPAMERFAVEVLNAAGKPVTDLSVTFESAGSREGNGTNARGIAIFIGPAAAPTSVSVANPKQLRDLLDRQPAAAPVDPPAGAVVQPLAELSPVSLKGGTTTKLVITREVRRVRLVGMFFDTDKCFLLPSAMEGIRTIKKKYDEHPKSNLLVVGHTDTSGHDEHNLKLSLERADAIAAFLTDDADAWAVFFDEDQSRTSKTWGTREVQLMLATLPEGETPYLPSGGVDGVDGPETKAAVRAFQQAKGLKVDGIAGPKTRKALITDYIALDETSLPGGVTLATHGCGENFPVAETADGQRSAEDRRAEMFFFDGPIAPPAPGKTSKRGSAEYPAWVAGVTETVDVTSGADVVETVRIRIQLCVKKAFQYSLAVGGKTYEGKGDVDGIIDHEVPAGASTGTLTATVEDTEEAYEWDLELSSLEPADSTTGMQRRLMNLGYYAGPVTGTLDDATHDALRDFQADSQLDPTGEYDDATRQALNSRHD